MRELAKIVAYFFRVKSCALILQTMDWVTFWAIFSQTHLVTLDARFFVPSDTVIFATNNAFTLNCKMVQRKFLFVKKA
jgi:hypothetical protein